MSGELRKECSKVWACGNAGTTSCFGRTMHDRQDRLVNLIGMSWPGPCLLLCPVPVGCLQLLLWQSHGLWDGGVWVGNISCMLVPVYDALFMCG